MLREEEIVDRTKIAEGWMKNPAIRELLDAFSLPILRQLSEKVEEQVWT